jgi:anti-sigma B factor antagonist
MSGSVRILVSANEKFACIHISGRASVASSVDFKMLLDQLFQRGCTLFVVDLTECAWMDSTFLGVLAGFALRLNPTQANHAARTIELFNPNARLSRQLEETGVLQLFKTAQGTAPSDTCAPDDMDRTEASREDVVRTCLQAHETLMSLNPANVARFKDVTAFLAEDLKKLKPGP